VRSRGIGRPRLLRVAVALAAALACPQPEGPGRAAAPETVRVEIAGAIFDLELALEPAARARGLGGRSSIPRNGGMFFVNARPRPLSMVMRDCAVPIDVAFLDARGRVLSIHAMAVEPPRRPDETPETYERRLRGYPSGAPAQFAVETAGGRLAELGLEVGQRIVFDARALLWRAR
jgi:uncharacterized membrane protein (UPF0127 family)